VRSRGGQEQVISGTLFLVFSDQTNPGPGAGAQKHEGLEQRVAALSDSSRVSFLTPLLPWAALPSGMMVQDPNRRRRGGEGAMPGPMDGERLFDLARQHGARAGEPGELEAVHGGGGRGEGEGEGARSRGRGSVWAGRGTPPLLLPTPAPPPQQHPPDTSSRHRRRRRGRRRQPLAMWCTCTATVSLWTTGP